MPSCLPTNSWLDLDTFMYAYFVYDTPNDEMN